jgi:hypothetical protein
MTLGIAISKPCWLAGKPATVIEAAAACYWSKQYWRQPIVYIMACMTYKGTSGAIYVGQALDGADRLAPDHEKYPEARRYCLSHIHVIEVGKSDLGWIERFLIERRHPHLNKYYNTDYEWAKRYPGPAIADEFYSRPSAMGKHRQLLALR